jgi:hypothetical protein
MMSKDFLLYITVNNVNGKVYGGQHIGYRTDDYIGSGPTIFLKAVKKYGREKFTRRWLKLKIDSKQKLDLLERKLIRRLKYKYGKNCYNIHIGGTGGYLLHYCDENYRKVVSERISVGKKKQYKNGLSKLQILGAKKRSLTLKERHKNDEEFQKRHSQKCKDNSEKLKEFYKKNGTTEKQKENAKKLREFGHFKLNIRVTHPNGTTQEYLYNYTNFMNELKIDGEYFTMLSKGQNFRIKRRTKMTTHNFDVGCIFESTGRIDD